MVAAIMAAAIDKTARGVLRTDGSANGIGFLTVGTGVLVRDRSVHFRLQQRPQIRCKKKCAILPLVPRQIVRACSQKQYSDTANENLNPKRIQAGLDRSVGTKRKHDADAEHLERVLAALDRRREQAPLQNWRIRATSALPPKRRHASALF
jgi:hypothetical protein